MVPVVQLWSGHEVRVLRKAMRLSQRAFAARLGVSERMVAKWEANGGQTHPRPVNQEALDSTLAAADAGAKARFVQKIDASTSEERRPEPPAATVAAGPLLELPRQQRHPIDGKLMVLIEAGVFLSGADCKPVSLPEFWIDVYPTTNADYARFLTATGRISPHIPPERLDHPVVHVTWRDAEAYAEWSTKALPTASQWEKAARGPRGDIYPWGSTMTPAKCNVRESGIRDTTPVDRYHSGASPYGVYDLCGNTWEWCASPTSAGRRELKGSAWTSPFVRCTPSEFNDAAEGMSDDDTSFRLVTPVETMRALLTLTG